MSDDKRREKKGNRRRAVKEVRDAQKAATAKRPSEPKEPSAKKSRKSRALQGPEIWLRKIRNAFGAKAAREVFDLVDQPGRETLVLANKVLSTYTLLLLDAQTRLEKAIGTEAEPSVRAYLDDMRQTARVAKDMAMGLMRVRAQFVDEDLDSRPDAIELIGAEAFRTQLTTLTGDATVKH